MEAEIALLLEQLGMLVGLIQLFATLLLPVVVFALVIAFATYREHY